MTNPARCATIDVLTDWKQKGENKKMNSYDRGGSMVERAASRVRIAYLERQRTYKAYKLHLQEAKDTKELEGDLVFDRLREDMQTAKANHIEAEIAFQAVKACSPL